jgi:phage portal protein BeeE
MIAFLTFSISSITSQIQQCVNKRLLTPAERQSYYAEFSLEAFLKADSAARSAWYSQMTQNGIMTRDECRVKENLPRHGGNAGVLTVQTNLTPIDKLGESTDGQAAQAALKNWLGQAQE